MQKEEEKQVEEWQLERKALLEEQEAALATMKGLCAKATTVAAAIDQAAVASETPPKADLDTYEG
eukprot:6646875-Prorocentrum_lima.AAC.1